MTEDKPGPKAVMAAFIASWNRHDMSTLASLFAEDADFIDIFGNWFKDRASIKEALSLRHATVFKDTRFTEREVSVRFVRPDVAIVHAVIELSGAVDRQGGPVPPGLGVITTVLDKTGQGWRVIALQNTAIAPSQSI